MNNELYIKIMISVVAAYLLGSVSFAILLSRVIAKEDIRTKGSGNAGSTNMLRTYGKKAAAMTFLGDFLKGALAAWFGSWMLQGTEFDKICVGLCAIFALIGHTKPIFFSFRGGKGVATALGGLMMIDLGVFLPIIFFGFLMAGVTGYVSLAAITLATCFPIGMYLSMVFGGVITMPEVVLSIVLASLVIFNHRENITRLINGTERNIRRK